MKSYLYVDKKICRIVHYIVLFLLFLLLVNINFLIFMNFS